MTEQLFTESEITIGASLAEVWDALVNPEKTKIYMFGCEAISNWGVGDEILWKGAQDGIVYVKGHIVAFEPEKTFSFTVFDPNAAYADIPANYLTSTYSLATTPEGQTHLKVTQGDYASVAEGQKRYEDTQKAGGWAPVLEGIKKLAEQK